MNAMIIVVINMWNENRERLMFLIDENGWIKLKHKTKLLISIMNDSNFALVE